MQKGYKLLILIGILLSLATPLAAQEWVEQGWVYYQVEQGNQPGFYRMRPDGTKKERIVSGTVTSFFINKDYFYYATYENLTPRLYRKHRITAEVEEFKTISQDTCSKTLEQLYEGRIGDIEVIGDTIYYGTWCEGGMNTFITWHGSPLNTKLQSKSLEALGEIIGVKGDEIYFENLGLNGGGIDKLNTKNNQLTNVSSSYIYGSRHFADKLTATDLSVLADRGMEIVDSRYYYTPLLDYHYGSTEEYLQNIGVKATPEQKEYFEEIYRERINQYDFKTNKNVILTTDKVGSFKLYEGQIYYLIEDTDEVYKINQDGSQKTKVANLGKKNAELLAIEKGILYYHAEDESSVEYQLYQYDLKSKKEVALGECGYDCRGEVIQGHVFIKNYDEKCYLIHNARRIPLV